MEPETTFNSDPSQNEATDAARRMADAIIAISADAIISVDESQKIIRYNSGAAEIFGYSEDEIVGQHIDCLIPSRFREHHPAQIEGFTASPTVARRMGERRQISGLRKGGQEFPAEASISKTRIGVGWVFTVALRDITERVRSQRAQEFLAQATSVLNGTLDAASTIASIAALSLPLLGDWCVVFLSDSKKSFHRALAVDSTKERDAEMKALMLLPFRPGDHHPLLPCLNAGETVHIPDFNEGVLTAWIDSAEHEKILRTLAPSSMLAVPLLARGRQTGAITFFLDNNSGRVHDPDDIELVEELARRAGMALDNADLYALAQNAVRARDDVLAIVSHDLGNPLAAIRLSARVIARHVERQTAAGGDVDEVVSEQVGNISTSVQHMERLIKDLLDIKRIESGFLELDRERISVDVLLREVYELYHTLADARGITLVTGTPSQPLEVVADHARLLQVFSNLVGNALKFTSPGQTVTISAQRTPAGVSIAVTDTGPGIPQEHIPHIFDRFWQARRTGRQSIGLGLAIVKGIIDAHQGTIRVESEFGAGTTFTFTLPVAD